MSFSSPWVHIKNIYCQYNGTKEKVVILDFQETLSLLHPWRCQLFTTYITYTIYNIYNIYNICSIYSMYNIYNIFPTYNIYNIYIYMCICIYIYIIYIYKLRAHQRSSLDQTKILKAQTIYISITLAHISIICIYVISFILSK